MRAEWISIGHDPFVVSVIECSRCGGAHEIVPAGFEQQPIVVGEITFTMWASCPVNGEPILITHER